MQLTYASLPFAYDALEPHLSRAALEFHHGERHRMQVDRAKALAREVRLHDLPLEQIIFLAHHCRHQKGLLHCAVEAWNYAFLWRSMRPGGGGLPGGGLAALLDASFGGYRSFCGRFLDAAAAESAGGWVWLVLDGTKLAVHPSPPGESPLLRGASPLAVFHIWDQAGDGELANRRGERSRAFLEHLLNWEFVHRHLERPRVARSRLGPYVSQGWRSTGL